MQKVPDPLGALGSDIQQLTRARITMPCPTPRLVRTRGGRVLLIQGPPRPTWQTDKWHQSTRGSLAHGDIKMTLSRTWPPCLPKPLGDWHASLSLARFAPTPADISHLHPHRHRRPGAGHVTRVAAHRFRVSESFRPPGPLPSPLPLRVDPSILVWFSRSCSGFRGGIRNRGGEYRARACGEGRGSGS